jgi:phospholipase/carboxylesterase
VEVDEIVLPARSDAEKLVFIFHGYGADKNDLQFVGEAFAKSLPTAEIHLPNGFEVCDEGFGRQWFALEGNDVNNWREAFERGVPNIISYVDSVISAKKLIYSDTVIAGFSQGAIIALSLGLKYGVKAVVAFSGLLLSPGLWLMERKNTKVLLTHGEMDTVIPFSAMQLTEEALNNVGISVQTVASPNTGHSIDAYMLAQTVDFLREL